MYISLCSDLMLLSCAGESVFVFFFCVCVCVGGVCGGVCGCVCVCVSLRVCAGLGSGSPTRKNPGTYAEQVGLGFAVDQMWATAQAGCSALEQTVDTCVTESMSMLCC